MKSAREYFNKIDLPSPGQVPWEAFKEFYTDGATERPQSVLHDLSKHGYSFRYRPQCPEIPDQYQEYATQFGTQMGGGLVHTTSEQFSIPYAMPSYQDPSSNHGSILLQAAPANWVSGSNLRRSESEKMSGSLLAAPIVISSEPRAYRRDMETQPERHKNPIVPQEMQAPTTVQYIPTMIIGGSGSNSPPDQMQPYYQYAVEPVPANMLYTPANVTYAPYPATVPTTYTAYPWPIPTQVTSPTIQPAPEPQGQYRTE